MYAKILSPAVRFFTIPLPLEKSLFSKASSLNIFLYPELKSAGLKRQQEFLAGRYAAFYALRYFEPDHAYTIGIHVNGSPIWPAAYTGSITHTENFAACAIAKTRDLRSIGIDSERIIPDQNAKEISKNVLTQKEIHFHTEKGGSFFELNEYVCLIFSAKESIYKCLNPLTQTIFTFSDFEIADLDFLKNRLLFKLLKDLNSEFLTGYEIAVKFDFSNNSIHTAVELKAGQEM